MTIAVDLGRKATKQAQKKNKNATGNAAGQGLMRKAAENAITLIIIAAVPVRFEAMNELSQDFEQN